MTSPVGRTHLYRLFDGRDVPLYVGISVDLRRRWEEHLRRKYWWDQVDRTTTEVYPTWEAAHQAELIVIRVEYPVHNVQDVPVERRMARGLIRLLQEGEIPADAEMTALLWSLTQALADHLCKTSADVEREVAELEKRRFVPQFTADGDDEPSTRLNPSRQQMRQLLIGRGPAGWKAGNLWSQLTSGGFAVARETMHRWLAEDEKQGLVYRTHRPGEAIARWVWQASPV